MGGYPSAAAQMQPYQPENPLENYGRMIQLKHMMQQQQMQQQMLPGELQQQQQAIEAGGLENQQRQMQLQQAQSQMADQEAQNQAMQEWDGKDFNDLPTLIKKHGGSAQSVMATKQSILKYQKEVASYDKDRWANEKIKNDHFAQAIDNVKNLPVEQQPAAFEAAKADSVQLGYLDPQQAQQMAYQGPQQLDMLEKTLLGNAAVLDQQKAKETERHNQAGEINAATNAKIAATRLEMEAPGIVAGGRIKQQEARLGPGGVAAAQAAGRVKGEMNAVNAMIPGGAAAAATPIQGAPGERNESVLQGLNPSIANQVKALADGRMAFPAGFALKSPYWQAIIGLVSRYDPSFDAINYNARAKTRQDFTSGKSAQQVNALNTVIGHLDQLSKRTDDLDNTSLQTLNQVKNWYSAKTGHPQVTNYQAVVKSVSDELVRVWRQTGGAEADIKERLHELSSSNSPEQLHGAIAQIGHLLESKLDALQDQATQGMGTSPKQMVTPKSRQTLNNLEAKSGAGVTSPQAGGLQVGQTVTLKNGKTVRVTSVHPDGSFDAQ